MLRIAKLRSRFAIPRNRVLDQQFTPWWVSGDPDEFRGDPDEFPGMWKNKFDIVTCSGLINNNHLDYRLFEEMIMALKKGGHAIFAARFSYMGFYEYDFTIKEMEQEGRWKKIQSK